MNDPFKRLVQPAARVGFALAFLSLLSACQDPQTGQLQDAELNPEGFPVRITDDSGREVELGTPPERILSLVPSATEILLALGLEGDLVGRTDYDRDPAVAHLPSVGGGLEASTEVIVSLDPDLVIRFDAGSDPRTPARLDALGIRHVAIRPDGVDDVFRIVALLGTTTGKSREAMALERRLRDELDDVASQVAELPRPDVVILLGGSPPLVAGSGTFLDELVQVAGGRNIFADIEELYAPVSIEELLRREPGIIVLSEGGTLPSALSAIPVVRIPSEVQIPGVDLGASALLLAHLLHPSIAP
jgi:iron complex transport system substrate-binding protein